MVCEAEAESDLEVALGASPAQVEAPTQANAALVVAKTILGCWTGA